MSTPPSTPSSPAAKPTETPAAKPAPATAAKPPGFFVPHTKRPPTGDISKGCIVLHGEPKIGKTTFASEFPGSWFIATEPGQEWISAYPPVQINNWNHFLQWVAWMKANKPRTFGDGTPIRTLVIDTFGILYKHCFLQVCQNLGVEDPGELPHGKGWSRITNELDRVFNEIRTWPYGLILICHTRHREIQATKQLKTEPDIGAAAMRWAIGSADLILYAHKARVPKLNDKGEPVGIMEYHALTTKATATIVAGGRPIGTTLPPVMPLSFAKFREYFPLAWPDVQAPNPAEEGPREVQNS